MYGDRAMAEQDERKGDRGADAARPADACADLLWDRSPATAEAVARFFARTIGGDARYISHGEIQGGLSDDGVTWCRALEGRFVDDMRDLGDETGLMAGNGKASCRARVCQYGYDSGVVGE